MAFKMKGNPYKLGKMATKSTMKMAKKAAMKMKPKGDVDTPMDLKKDPMMMKKESSAMKQVERPNPKNKVDEKDRLRERIGDVKRPKSKNIKVDPADGPVGPKKSSGKRENYKGAMTMKKSAMKQGGEPTPPDPKDPSPAKLRKKAKVRKLEKEKMEFMGPKNYAENELNKMTTTDFKKMTDKVKKAMKTVKNRKASGKKETYKGPMTMKKSTAMKQTEKQKKNLPPKLVKEIAKKAGKAVDKAGKAVGKTAGKVAGISKATGKLAARVAGKVLKK